jgi:hypothetical protein
MKKVNAAAAAALAAALVMAVVSISVAAYNNAKGPLDGSKWQVSLAFKGQKPQADTLNFAKGRFESIACRPYGFGTAAYGARKLKSGWSFWAITKSHKEGTMHWTGKVVGDKISGTVQWQTAKGKISYATYSGERKSEKRKA